MGGFKPGRGSVGSDLTVRGGDINVEGTNPKVTVGDGGEEDTMVVFDGASVDYRIGLDDGNNTLEIGAGSAHGTTAGLVMNSDGDITKI